MASGFNHGEIVPPLQEYASHSHPSTSLESILASWPAKLCLKCASMTGTSKGLQELMSRDGYVHFGRYDLKKSAEMGCVFCIFISDAIDPDIWEDHDDPIATAIDPDIWNDYYDPISTQKLSDSEYLVDNEDGVGELKGPSIMTAQPGEDKPKRTKKISISCFSEDLFTPEDGNLKAVDLRHFKVGYRSGDEAVYYPDAFSTQFEGFTNAKEDKYLNSAVVDGNDVQFSFDQLLLPLSFADESVVKAIKHRLNDCDLHHKSTCPSKMHLPLPSRVIDVEAIGNGEELRLHITHPDELGQYAALSYCWGEPPHTFICTKAMLDNPSMIDWSHLPATIADAVTVTRSLGIKYLWIDALCIAQDDDADKTKEIKYMGKIYNNARVTIAAASAQSVQAGFLNRDSRGDLPLPILFPEGGYGKLWVRSSLVLPAEPLDSRGWALQEYLLSPRVLYYGSRELFWKCQQELFVPVLPSHGIYPTDSFSQAHVRLPANIFDIASDHVINTDDFWIWVQAAYSVRDLRLFDDRFRALGGIAEFIRE
ncbi:HET-domain-containing protein [Hyaloscypha variabilis F]|uniref:HET-domain-containing protein n=1 Tax=Hyaloscypha variabilis (strain UAMH 11265 / GT02V1 / F) TaxID=1149755 RepID=A0A2J6SA93_HYAVF|nr:HET-domain-containing protein [Hyaloscypha variabilis F]